MSDNALQTYIDSSRKKGRSEDDIRKNLLDAGWDLDVVEGAINRDSSAPPPPPPPLSQVTAMVGSVTMWDTFEHILLFSSMYIDAICTSVLLHLLIDRHFTDVSADPYNYSFSSNDFFIRLCLAGIIVTFPIFAILFMRITKRTRNNPALRSLKARKILIYLTLVLSFLIVIGDLIQTIFKLLSGELGPASFLHLLITLVVSGSIFTYYYLQIKEDRHIAER